ncbi:unnamed protein product [Clonostachys chloroleuca]|uniref:Uncharacterized protein n=1 Tax=Clonostachys chloroleuca TaxID=1926264 RepID=A0AA35PVQ0_9HYPO|nr:unnamed protein product [Clonostachys chloroleuca]
MPEVSNYGMTYETVVITPPVFLQWTRDRLEQRAYSSSESMLGVRTLADVKDSKVQPVHLQSTIFNHPTYCEDCVRGGNNYYTTAFSHLDGEVYVGRVIESGSDDINAYDDKSKMIHVLDRAHENQPGVFPPTDQKAGFVRDHASWYVSCKDSQGRSSKSRSRNN